MTCEKLIDFKECELVIFDLDGTLHSFNDISNNKATIKKEIIDILDTLKTKGIKIALASLNSCAKTYLEKYNILDYFDYIEYKNWGLYGDFKTDLFENISEKSKIPFQKMLFFDDRLSHCEEASLLKIKNIYVNRNTLLSWNDLYNGMSLFKMTTQTTTSNEDVVNVPNVDMTTQTTKDVVRRQGNNDVTTIQVTTTQTKGIRYKYKYKHKNKKRKISN